MLWGKKKLLVIDDAEIVRLLFYAEFEYLMDIITASDGESAISRAHTEKPDAIILDVNLPDTSGINVLRRLRASPETRSIPVVIITGADFNPATERAARAQANCRGFLSKLASGDEIRDTIREAMRSSRT